MNEKDDLKALHAPFSPIVVFDEGWGANELLKKHVFQERAKHLDEIFQNEMATEWEALIYLQNASLSVPLSQEWANIYIKLFKRLVKNVAGIDTEVDFLRDIDEKLTEDERRELDDLRRWIFKKQINALKKIIGKRGGKK